MAKAWEVKVVDRSSDHDVVDSEEMQKMLVDGWEPFAVVAHSPPAAGLLPDPGVSCWLRREKAGAP